MRTCSNCRFSFFAKHISKNICSKLDGMIIKDAKELARHCTSYNEKDDDLIDYNAGCSYFGLVERNKNLCY